MREEGQSQGRLGEGEGEGEGGGRVGGALVAGIGQDKVHS